MASQKAKECSSYFASYEHVAGIKWPRNRFTGYQTCAHVRPM